MARTLDLTGKRFGKLVAIRPTEKRDQGRVVWYCKCDCGNTCEVSSHSLTTGNTKSCGCLGKEKNVQPASDTSLLSYSGWRKAVLSRDRYICQRCGKKLTEDKLVAHHLDAYDNFPRFRTRLKNGVTLCLDCEADFHHEYGWTHNSRRQFDRWKGQWEEVKHNE